MKKHFQLFFLSALLYLHSTEQNHCCHLKVSCPQKKKNKENNQFGKGIFSVLLAVLLSYSLILNQYLFILFEIPLFSPILPPISLIYFLVLSHLILFAFLLPIPPYFPLYLFLLLCLSLKHCIYCLHLCFLLCCIPFVFQSHTLCSSVCTVCVGATPCNAKTNSHFATKNSHSTCNAMCNLHNIMCCSLAFYSHYSLFEVFPTTSYSKTKVEIFNFNAGCTVQRNCLQISGYTLQCLHCYVSSPSLCLFFILLLPASRFQIHNFKDMLECCCRI